MPTLVYSLEYLDIKFSLMANSEELVLKHPISSRDWDIEDSSLLYFAFLVCSRASINISFGSLYTPLTCSLPLLAILFFLLCRLC